MREFLDLILLKYRWFEPRRYGSAALDKAIEPSRIDLAPLVAHYEEHRSLCVAARTDRTFIWFSPILPSSPFTYAGSISWMTSVSTAAKATWRESFAPQVAELMRLVQSPLALAGLEKDIEGKQRRRVHKSIPTEEGAFTYSEDEFTVRDYSEGLPGLVWRNFYGPPFVRMFGQRFAALPTECHKRLGEDIVLVQPYELPTDAGTETGIARERELISLLGPECFYDHEHRTLPTRRPVLDSLGQPLH
ncbi:hypothetical protein [Vitiosangium sp. GDMCC 1.1324]|uniref:hypothetical protein n=1 Tax=Vitiosangium sp. (strain GDMCC 1.1324) TaxID=2138576 RepID=UPI000D39A572|nr:hypothetical protein [Vitiosangium sp. GDMCC 1.1324]